MEIKPLVTNEKNIRPFLKWAGNKYMVLPYILDVLPPAKRLIEPFLGSGAVFLNTRYRRYLLADQNADLIHLFQYIKTLGQEYIDFCSSFFIPENNDQDKYYDLRQCFNTTDDNQLKAALFLYLNKHGYNGLCRYNGSGGFNVPFGRYKTPPQFPKASIEHFYQHAKRAQFKLSDFRKTIQAAKVGDVIYCDPPYVPLDETAYFTSYIAGGFSESDQRALANLAKTTAARGIPVIISNHLTPFTKKIYHGAHIINFNVRRSISCKANNRKLAKELLAIFK